ncbi:BTB/POZ domain protein [Caligus rogercresseyi]|uniref:BTB/POZ domain protein n=1 Tax=Caligus rogercresseyi TaxID=217165 RepID=A0A7T8GTD2_CALRO|nr:BTB/POZ domain protein [Caligus rogercresseyi]
MGSPTRVDMNIDNSESLKSVGYKNMLITDKHLNESGDIQLVCKMNIIKEDSSLHSLSSDLKSLINDEKSSDVVIETAEGKKFKLCKRGPLCKHTPCGLGQISAPGLKTHCEKHLVEVISPKNVASFLLLADKYKCEDLKKSALTYCKDNVWYIMKDEQWKVIEEEKPDLFEEAVSKVVKDSCFSHTECLKKKGKRFEMEKYSSDIIKAP